MKFLIDMPVSPKTCDFLNKKGFDAVHLYPLGKAKVTDIEVIELAKTENRTIVTMDIDFPTILAHSHAKTPGVVLIRMMYATVERIIQRLMHLLKAIPEKEIKNSVVVLEDFDIRIRKLPLP